MSVIAPSNIFAPPLPEDARKYAPVLQRAVELLGAEGNDDMKLGAAIDRASSELGIEVPERVRGPLYVAAFRIIGAGRVPGAPDA